MTGYRGIAVSYVAFSCASCSTFTIATDDESEIRQVVETNFDCVRIEYRLTQSAIAMVIQKAARTLVRGGGKFQVSWPNQNVGSSYDKKKRLQWSNDHCSGSTRIRRETARPGAAGLSDTFV